jgi:pimeloyl-ACP methyl ester carboxylesterase
MGNNWLLLRGLTRESGHWGDFLPQLRHACPQVRIQCLDLPGCGVLYQQTSPTTVAEITRFVRRQAFKSGHLQQKVTLLSLSLGGMVAWEWMQQFPDDIQSAVLMNSSLASVSPFYQRMRWQCYRQLLTIVCQHDRESRETAIVKLVSNLESAYKKVAAEWGKIQRLRPVSHNNALRQIIAAANYRPKPEKPRCPVLLLNSLGDRLVSPLCSEAISHRYGLALISHPWAGHDLCVDDPQWVIAQLQRWLF